MEVSGRVGEAITDGPKGDDSEIFLVGMVKTKQNRLETALHIFICGSGFAKDHFGQSLSMVISQSLE